MRFSDEYDWSRRGADSNGPSLSQVVHTADDLRVRERTQVFRSHHGSGTAEEHDDWLDLTRARLSTKSRENRTDRFVGVCSQHN